MIKSTRVGIACLLSLLMLFLPILFLPINSAFADARVFNLITPNPQSVVDTLQAKYGDRVQIELVQQKLVVIGSKQQLDEISAQLTQVDPVPTKLRLQLRTQVPTQDGANVITYSSGSDGYTVDSVEGAFVVLNYNKFAQQVSDASSDGWWVAIDKEAVAVDELTLQVNLQKPRNAIVLVSYTKEENQQRRVFGNAVVGELGTWIALLPQPSVEKDTISSGAKHGSQLYLRVDKALGKTPVR